MKHLNQALAANSAANAEDVVATKLFLRHQGHYAPPKSGISQFPDRALFDAIKTFQQSQGLKVDGVMNPEGETETAIKTQAQQLQSKGRNGDTILAHINPAEAQLLNDITDGGSINPDTGLPEFFFGDFFSGLSDSFSSIGTSMSDSFSSIGDSMSSFGDSFSSGLSDIGNTVSSNLDSTFGKGFSDQVGNFAGGLTSRVAGKYVSQKIGQKVGGPLGGLLGDTVGGAVGNTLGDTVSGAFKPSQPLGAGLSDNLKPNAAAQSSATPSMATSTAATPAASTPAPTKAPQNLGVVGNGLGMQSHGLGMSSHGLGMGEKPQPKPQPPAPKPEPLPSLKGLNIPAKPQLSLQQKIQSVSNQMKAEQAAKPKPVSPAALKSVIAQVKANQQQGGGQNLLQNGAAPAANASANAKPIGTAPVLSAEADAANMRVAQASAKTTDHSALKRDVTDALKTGGEQAQLEVQDLTQKMDQLQPGTGTTLAQEVGLKPQNHPEFPPRKPEPPQKAGVPIRHKPDLKTTEKKNATHKTNYELSKKAQADGHLNDGFIGNDTKGNWNEKPDDNIHLGGNTSSKQVQLKTDGPIRIKPESVTFGADSAKVSINWYQLDENGKVIKEFRPDKKALQWTFSGGMNGGFSSYDFAPPYPTANPNGYLVTITKNAQGDVSGNSFGMGLNIYSQKEASRVNRLTK